MNAPESSCLLTINAPPALEDALVDWLLGTSADRGFSCYRADGHGARHDQLTIEEQVRGRQRRVEFRVMLESSELDAMLTALQGEFSGADLFYFVTPVYRAGRLRQ